MKLSPSAIPSTCGPITIPSSSSITTTGGARLRGSTATSVAASAATATIAKKEVSSTSIKAVRRGTAGTSPTLPWPVDRARRGISGALSPAIRSSGAESRPEGLAFGVSTPQAALTARSCATWAREPGQVRKEAALSGSRGCRRPAWPEPSAAGTPGGLVSTTGARSIILRLTAHRRGRDPSGGRTSPAPSPLGARMHRRHGLLLAPFLALGCSHPPRSAAPGTPPTTAPPAATTRRSAPRSRPAMRAAHAKVVTDAQGAPLATAGPRGYWPADLQRAYTLPSPAPAAARPSRSSTPTTTRAPSPTSPSTARSSACRRAPRPTAASARSTRTAASPLPAREHRLGARRSRSTSTWSPRSARTARSCWSRRTSQQHRPTSAPR